jgi:hypothetical protein
LRKISYSLHVGIIGNKHLIKEIFLDTLKKSAIESNLSEGTYVFLIVFKQIPIKIKIFFAENLENLVYNFEEIQKLDILILTLDLYKPESLESISKPLLDELNETYSFQGLSVLVGMDIEHKLNNTPPKNHKISRFQLKKTTKDLNLIYCFEIFNRNKDIHEIFNTLLDDFILRFQYSNNELFEAAKDYGKKLMS